MIKVRFSLRNNMEEKDVLEQNTSGMYSAECPSYDILILAPVEGGIDCLKEKYNLAPGIPLMVAQPIKCQEVLTWFKNCDVTCDCEWNYDGDRAQVHLNEDGTVKIYSRNQEDNTPKFPDIIKRLNNCLSKEVKSAVLDCESSQLGIGMMLWKRKINVQVCLFRFDLQHLNALGSVPRPVKENQ